MATRLWLFSYLDLVQHGGVGTPVLGELDEVGRGPVVVHQQHLWREAARNREQRSPRTAPRLPGSLTISLRTSLVRKLSCT